MIADIETFFKKPFVYSTAVELYLQYSSDKSLIALLKSGENSFTTQKVIQALRKISDDATTPDYQAKEKRATIEDFQVKTHQKHIKIEYASLPSSLKQKMDEKSALYRHSNTLFSQLEFLNDDQSRLDSALEILNNFDLIDKIFSEVEDYQERGIYIQPNSGERSLDSLNGLELAKLLDNLKKNLSKVRGVEGKQQKFIEINERIKEVEDALSKR